MLFYPSCKSYVRSARGYNVVYYVYVDLGVHKINQSRSVWQTTNTFPCYFYYIIQEILKFSPKSLHHLKALKNLNTAPFELISLKLTFIVVSPTNTFFPDYASYTLLGLDIWDLVSSDIEMFPSFVMFCLNSKHLSFASAAKCLEYRSAEVKSP